MFTKVYENVKSFIKENYKFLLLLIIMVALFKIELPYKIYTPGGMVSLSSRIEVENGYSSKGELGMAYVSMVNGSIPFILLSYVIPNWDVVPTKELTYENETIEEMIKADKIAMQQAMDQAIISAYRLADKEITINKEEAHITYIDEKAQTNLQLFDILLEVEGKKITNLDELKSVINEHQVGERLSLKVKRNESIIDTYAEVYDTEDGPKIGVAITTTYQYDENPNVTIKAKESESGPSGGLMMSLAIYDALTEEDITKGKKIIGTGTISMDGTVGAIGGVRYKLLGAVKKKCDIFLVPEENYEEAIEVKEEKNLDINIISVKTLEDAINALKAL